jgi:hypothetical protein
MDTYLEACCYMAATKTRYWRWLDAHVKLWWLKEHFTVIKLDENNRMLRIGFGKNEGRGFFRVDLWSVGLRIT